MRSDAKVHLHQLAGSAHLQALRVVNLQLHELYVHQYSQHAVNTSNRLLGIFYGFFLRGHTYGGGRMQVWDTTTDNVAYM